MQKKILLILSFALLIAIFAINNAHQVSVRFFNWQFEMPLVFIILGSIVLGALIMSLLGSIKYFRINKKIRELERNNEKLSQENNGDIAKNIKDENQTNKIYDSNQEEKNNTKTEDEINKNTNKRFKSLNNLKEKIIDKFS